MSPRFRAHFSLPRETLAGKSEVETPLGFATLRFNNGYCDPQSQN